MSEQYAMAEDLLAKLVREVGGDPMLGGWGVQITDGIQGMKARIAALEEDKRRLVAALERIRCAVKLTISSATSALSDIDTAKEQK